MKCKLSGFLVLPILFFCNFLQAQTVGAGHLLKKQVWNDNRMVRPHSSINKKEFETQYAAHPEYFEKAFKFLKETDLGKLKAGKYPIDGDNVFATVSEGQGRDFEQTRWEAHKNYLDIHYVIAGKEMIGMTPVSLATELVSFDPVKDIGFYTSEGKIYPSDGERFFIFFPQDAHRPGIKAKDKALEKKVVIKIKVSS